MTAAPKQKPTPPAGEIITFYSYKGGTGRSMLLANVAWILASAGRRVLVVDWDLEAPGVYRYFQPFLIDPDMTATDGIIDMVLEYAMEAISPGDPSKPDWYRRQADVLRYACSLDHDFGEGTLDLLPAGRQGASYSTRVNTFDWRNFYEAQGGGAFLEAVKERMRATYDYILIDSRTGVSDTSGICTVQLPDTLVVCFTMNNQSIEGASGVATSVLEQRRDRPLRIFPVPTRVEDAEKEKLEQRRSLMRERFALFPHDPDRGMKSASKSGTPSPDEYWGGVEMPYVPYYAYEEILTTIGDRSGQPTSLLSAAERLTSWLTSGRVQRMPPLAESSRLELLAMYAPKPKDVPEDELAREAERVFSRMDANEQAAVRRLFTRLVRVARPNEGRDQLITAPLAEVSEDAQLARACVAAGILRIEMDSNTGEQVVRFANPALLERWNRLGQWIDEDRAFLGFRELLRSNRNEWERSGRDAETQLAGATLQVAQQWEHTRGPELSAEDRDFIAISRAGRRRRRIVAATRASIGLLLVIGFLGTMYASSRRTARRSDAEALTAAASTFVAAGQLDSAAAAYTSAIERDPTLAAAWHGRAHLLIDLGRPDSALADIDRALAVDSANAEAWADRGAANALLGDQKAAVADYDRAISLGATTSDAYFNRAIAYQALGEDRLAADDFQAVLASNPDAQTREAANARLRQLGVIDTVGLPQIPSAGERRVYIQFADEADRAIVETMAKELVAAGWRVPAPERKDGATRGDVRAFRESDLPLADQLGDMTEKVLASQGYRLRLQRIQAKSATEVPAGQLEIWLPRLAYPVRSK